MGPIYPGHSISNTLMIQNDLNIDVVLKEIGMDVKIKDREKFLDIDEPKAKDYMEYAWIKIDCKDRGTLFDGSFKEFGTGIKHDMLIGKNGNLDLVFTVGMKDKEAQTNVEGVEGLLDFHFSIEQLKDDSGSDNDNYEPEDKMPLLSNGEDIEDHWAHDCIETLIKKGIINGYEDGTIRPEDKITRGEAAVIVGRALGIKEDNSGIKKYVDPIPKWANGYVMKLTEMGVLEGYENGEFRANRYITREEMTKVLVLSFNKKAENKIELKFIDSESIESWAVEHVMAGVENNVIEGYPDNTFRPKENITRAETFTIICKLLGLHEPHRL